VGLNSAERQPQTLTTGYKYDADNRLTETDYADGTKTQVQYNAIGKQSATIHPLNRTTNYTYDSLGRLTTTTYPDTTTESATFDAENHRLTSTDRTGRTTTYVLNTYQISSYLAILDFRTCLSFSNFLVFNTGL
jgi:YD repeat-containing protein